MKNYGIFIIAGLAALMSACGGKEKAQGADSDSAVVEVLEEEKPDSIVYYLNSESIGPLVVGGSLSELPDSCNQLYTRHETHDTMQGNAVTYFDGDEAMFTVMEYHPGTADMVILESPRIKVAAPGSDFSIGDSFRNILTLPDVEKEWVQTDDGSEGQWFWSWSGLWFGVDPSHLTKSLSNHLYNVDEEPDDSDFDDTVKIGYIATGLPY